MTLSVYGGGETDEEKSSSRISHGKVRVQGTRGEGSAHRGTSAVRES